MSAAMNLAVSAGTRSKRLHALLVEALDEFRVLGGARELGRDPLDDGVGRGHGRQRPVPALALKPGESGFGDGRHLGGLRGALGARYAEHADVAGLRLRQRLRQRHEHGRDVAAHQIGHGRGGAAIAHAGHIEAGTLEEQRHEQIAQAARTAAARIRKPLRLHLHVGDELGDAGDRQLGIHHQDLRIDADHADRLEVLDRVVGRLGDRRKDRHHRRPAPEQRVAIGRRTGHGLSRNGAVAADPILDHELLPERLAQALAGQARNDVDVAAGRERDDDPDRPLRPSRRLGPRGCKGERSNE